MANISASRLFALASLLGAGLAIPYQVRSADDGFDWASVKPSRQLEYHDCHDSFKCARLQVPLDWTECAAPYSCDNATAWAAIAIVTLPATVPKDDPSFGGTVVINPGGPGGSGTMEAILGGQYLQGIVDGEKHYEILGFDPRGVGLTTPPADCYKNDFLRANDILAKGGLPPVTPGTIGLKLFYEASKGLSDLCAGAGPDSIFAHMSTGSVARDMLEIVDRIDEQKNKSCKKKSRDVPKLQYLGVSYGTLLGNTFASMFHGRVSRMLLDGVVDADDYIQKGNSITLVDAEAVLDNFYKTCFDAGSSCVLRQDSDKSAGDIRNKINAVIQNLEENPAVEVHNGRMQLVTSHVVKDAIRQMMYQPIKQYELASQVLALAVAGNYSVLLDTPAGNATAVYQTDMCVKAGASFPPSEFSVANEAGLAVFCGDSYQDPDLHNVTWAENTAKHFFEQSPTTGESWSHIALGCSGWKYNPKYAYRGPFGNPGPKEGDKNTPDAPILFLSNRYDHATPLVNAYTMSQKHGGSAVVVQEAAGHCALLTSTSKCTKDIVSKYFATGVVPANNTICQPDCQPGIPYKECPGFVSF